jgi:hypothetical protein
MTPEQIDTLVTAVQIVQWKGPAFLDDLVAFTTTSTSTAATGDVSQRLMKSTEGRRNSDFPELGDKPPGSPSWSTNAESVQPAAPPTDDLSDVESQHSTGSEDRQNDHPSVTEFLQRQKEMKMVQAAAKEYGVTDQFIYGLLEQASHIAEGTGSKSLHSATSRITSTGSTDPGSGQAEERRRSTSRQGNVNPTIQSRQREGSQESTRSYRGQHQLRPSGRGRDKQTSSPTLNKTPNNEVTRKRSRSRSADRTANKRTDRKPTPPSTSTADAARDVRIDQLTKSVEALTSIVTSQVKPR